MYAAQRTILVGFLLVSSVLVSCSDEGQQAPPGGDPDVGSQMDLDSGGDSSEEDVGLDAAPGDLADSAEDPMDPDAVEDLPDLGPPRDSGELCVADRQCVSGLCFQLEAGADQGFCSDFCVSQEDCPMEGFECVRLENGGSDGVSICAPTSACLDGDRDGYGLGPGCDGPDCDDEDPDSYPGADELCNGADNDCDGEVDNRPLDEGQRCQSDQPGVCAGGLTACMEGALICVPAQRPTEEFCDGLDNDCDGVVDEGQDGEPLREACYSGPQGTEGVGSCAAGARACVDGQVTECLDQVLPLFEVCDGLDNDCDGLVDEDNPGAGVRCETGMEGSCGLGLTSCVDGALVCAPRQGQQEEICDGLDNDCDGMVDEGLDGGALTRACYEGPEGTEGVGVCVSGARTCEEGVFGACQDQVLPTAEICDSLDNDCNGQTDDGNPAGGFVCQTGLPGLCARGATLCTEEGTRCEPFFEASEEVCDGLDNDCDGLVDEGEDGQPLARSCYDGDEALIGTGACVAGAQICREGDFGACEGQVLPVPELCDGLDNDCDGAQDEDNPGAGVRCQTGAQGVCAVGVTRCSQEGLACEPLAQPSEEVCDGLDNDCDGLVDEGEDGQPLARSCYDGDEALIGTGACVAGARVCQDGQYGICEGQVLPVPELCDGLDNDCDGAQDEDNPGAGVRCQTGAQGVCAVGVTRCSQEGLACEPLAQPSEEVCDGLDNDCDGMVDEGPEGQPLARSCFDGDEGLIGAGVCVAGVELCQQGEYGLCEGQVLPGLERCDGQDNDCDGQVDEEVPGAGLRCATEEPGVCSSGVTACSQGALICEPSVEPGAEVCDGLDNDCDGAVDNGFAGLGQPCFAGLGICRRAGVQVCDGDNPRGAPVCDAEPGQGREQEICDFNDDDCDGEVDEDFQNGDGVYDQVANCGSCGIDCEAQWPGGPESYHVTPLCQVQGPSALCGFACVGGYVDADGIPDNGCEFLPDEGAIYVSSPANGGDDAGACGAWDDPCATLGRGLDRAQAVPGKSRVRVSDGLYRESVRMRDGVSLLGGHNAQSWVRSPEVFVSVINGFTANPQSADRIAVDASGVLSTTELSGFTINAEDAAPGGNSVGVYALNAGGGLLVRDNLIFAGDGGNGLTGAAGGGGAPGVHGAAGTDSVILNSCNTVRSPSAGGGKVCPLPQGGTRNVSGGQGGNSICPMIGQPNGNGAGGQGAQPGTGGAAAYSFGSDRFNRCIVANNAPITPSPGLNGGAGGDGVGGQGAAGGNRFDAGQWRGNSGAAAVSGTPGSGGGGGGSAAGVDASQQTGEYYYGATGGGGGSGGCGGSGGGGGGGGGGSFAVLLVFGGAGPSSQAQIPQISGNVLVRGVGGAGGSGGTGGSGGDPGLGAAGGVGRDAGTFGGCMFEGAVGASGGRGGHGGGGGGGQGGASYDLYVQNSNGISRGFEQNTFMFQPQMQTGGGGGPGGSSNNTEVGIGQDGAAGPWGTLLNVP